MDGYEIVEHPADIGFRFWADTLPGAYCQAAKALTSMLAGDKGIIPRRSVQISLEASDRLDLLFDFLGEILYYFDAEQFLVADIRFAHLSETALSATLGGEPFDPARHWTPYYVKAITYHQMKLEPHEGCWEGAVYVDI